MEILADYEEIFKIMKFAKDNITRIPYANTFERLRNDLKEQYIENLDEKINRWISITKAPYFQNEFPVKFYIQAKMLYRDGFYEAAIAMSRGICEMICQNILDKIDHPFGTEKDLGEEKFRTLVNFIAIPKEIDKNFFKNNLVDKIEILDDKNLIKSSYSYSKDTKTHNFKQEIGKNSRISHKIMKIFEELNFNDKEFFTPDTFKKLHQIYDLGNIYIHARKSLNDAKHDAFDMVDGIGYVLFELYGIKDFSNLAGETLVSAYSDFPDICSGITYYMEAAISPLEAMRVYHNLPSDKHVNRFKSACGTWKGEWKNKDQKNSKGNLVLYVDDECNHEGDCIHGKLNSTEGGEISNLNIQLFGEYFRITGYKDDKKIVEFELSFFDEHTIIGKNLLTHGNALFNKIV